jgi:SAM-dependent methyltransferase
MPCMRNIEGRAANLLGRVGGRFDQDWLVYSPLRMHLFHLMAKDDAPAVSEALTKTFTNAHLFADVGCGSGAFAAALNRRGRVAIGCEKSAPGRWIAHLQGVDARPFDLNATPPTLIPSTFDVAYSFEVAEHLPPMLGDRLVALLCATAPIVVFTAALPGQGGTGHVNEQPRSYWAERFLAHGHVLDGDATAEMNSKLRTAGVTSHWFLDNLVVYQRSNSGAKSDS